jgi:hypothetical protein
MSYLDMTEYEGIGVEELRRQIEVVREALDLRELLTEEIIDDLEGVLSELVEVHRRKAGLAEAEGF